MNSYLRYLLCLFVCTAPILAWGALGDNIGSIVNDQAKIKAVRRSSVSTANYSVQEMRGENGTTIREYISSDGTIFAIAWNGPFMPDLRQLLGQYFDQFNNGVAAIRKGRGPLHLQQDNLVVQSGGHMRAFSGRAYLPQALPQGVTADDIK
jgi:hypothetical protein